MRIQFFREYHAQHEGRQSLPDEERTIPVQVITGRFALTLQVSAK
jgi:hypothetical protein